MNKIVDDKLNKFLAYIFISILSSFFIYLIKNNILVILLSVILLVSFQGNVLFLNSQFQLQFVFFFFHCCSLFIFQTLDTFTLKLLSQDSSQSDESKTSR